MEWQAEQIIKPLFGTIEEVGDVVKNHRKPKYNGRVIVECDIERSEFGDIIYYRDNKRIDGIVIGANTALLRATRQYRKCYTEIPKKNGKSELAAGVALFGLFADDEPAAEVYGAATDRDQASIVFDVASGMVQQSAALSQRSKIIDSRKRIAHTSGSFYRVLSAEAHSKHGYSIHYVIFDELHAQPNRDLYDVLTLGSGSARRQPLFFFITTAGYDRNSICWEVHEYARQIIAGTIKDERFLAVMYSADEKDDWTDEKVWRKCNPSIGEIIKIEDLRSECKEAQASPALQNTFRRLRLNQWTQQASRWIDMQLWDEQAGTVIEEELIGRECYGALDVSSVSDFTCWAMAFPHEDRQHVDFLFRFWCPEEKIYDKRNRYSGQYQVWARDGYLIATPGNAIDKSFIKKQILEDAEKFNLIDMNVDALFQGYDIAMELARELGDDRVIPMRQGFISYAAPMKDFEERLLKKCLHHGGNPVARFCADNVVVAEDAAGNYKPDKENSQSKIDGIVCAVMALDRLGRRTSFKSVYEDRGLVAV
jgi:phage terminase large subunit-like protein